STLEIVESLDEALRAMNGATD
ncbi:MAG: hypothetical protein RIS51_800, partial [Actinomycetota bacterium]